MVAMKCSGPIVASLLMSAVFFSQLVTGEAQCDQTDQKGPLLCCKGRNSSCIVDQTTDKEESIPHRRTVCYCDEFCKSAGDCCEDFEEAQRKCTSNGQLNVFFIILSQLNLIRPVYLGLQDNAGMTREGICQVLKLPNTCNNLTFVVSAVRVYSLPFKIIYDYIPKMYV